MTGSGAVKLEIFVPVSHLEELREALRKAGAGSMGHYDSAMSYSPVKGCWRALPGASPFNGEIGALTEADEYKIEVIVKAEALEKTVKAVKAAHPYETPVINAIALLEV